MELGPGKVGHGVGGELRMVSWYWIFVCFCSLKAALLGHGWSSCAGRLFRWIRHLQRWGGFRKRWRLCNETSDWLHRNRTEKGLSAELSGVIIGFAVAVLVSDWLGGLGPFWLVPA